MKTQFRGLLVALVFLLSLLGTVIGADKPAKLPVVAPPSKYGLETFVRPAEVLYSLTGSDGAVYAQFIAGHDATLRSLRLVINDSTVYNWDCQSRDAKVVTSQEGDSENGVHHDNAVAVDRAKWLTFFQKRVALRPFEFQDEGASLSVYERPVEFTGYGNAGDLKLESHFRPVGTDVSVRIDALDFIVSFPRKGEFYLGKAGGKFLPLQKTTTGGWELALAGDKLAVVNELPTAKK